jgi:hypothetical protein
MEQKTTVKNFNQLTEAQQALFLELSAVIEKRAKENNMNTKAGIYTILEMLVTLTLAMKSFYLLKHPDPNDISEGAN